MTINHHPSDETLLRYASGTLEPGPRVVVAVHVSGCRACEDRGADFEAIGGSVLEDIEAVELSASALDHMMVRIDAMSGKDSARTVGRKPARAEIGIRLPDVLDNCDVGGWRWIGPGIRFSRVTLPGEPEANVMLLKVAPGRKLPKHTHSGREYMQVLSGSFADARGRYRPGDMDEADSKVEHQPIVDPQAECICIAALEGQMRLRGFFGRIIQPFIG
ncbi:ChrR family anti-sigma-E factor [Mesorhizobium sp. CN2-181]|jgi:putative transcriptional regulator|uniref:ChrR family anti-sigma-E factor n=1 Tax=Mesorhizobium yinganensis TaxID=3157707 RepID=UPI0032B7C2A3